MSTAFAPAIGGSAQWTDRMQTRVLPPAEWDQLRGTELETVWALLNPSDAQIVVVEQDGAIVGCWACFTVLHCEGVWIAPEHRGKTSVARRLWTRMLRLVRARGAKGFVTAATTPDVRALLEGRAARLPGDHYVYQVPGGSEACRQQ